MLSSRFLSVIFLSFFLAPGIAHGAVVTDLFGDIDSFGTDKDLNATISVGEIIASTQDAGDGVTDLWINSNADWAHIYALPVGTAVSDIASVRLTISTYDLEDGGAGDGLGPEPYDSLLFFDGVEIAGAFDNVFTDDGDISPTTQLPRNITTFILDPSFFAAVLDGIVNVRLNPSGGARNDAISIDYAILEIETREVPLPAAAWLFLTGAVGLSRFRRRG